MLIEMTDREVRDAYRRADAKQTQMRAVGSAVNVFHDDSGVVERSSTLAEDAFYKAFPWGVRSAAPEGDPKAGDGGYDFYFPRGRLTVDVKSRIKDDTMLILPGRHYPPKADIYVLMSVDVPKVWLVGWAWGSEIEERGHHSPGAEAGPHWYLWRNELHLPGSLFKELR